jgi:MFS family permease
VQTLPVTAFALVGGAIADRVDLRRMVIVCESVLALVAAALAVLALTGAIEAWQLYALGFVQGIAIALDAPARHTLVFRIVGRDDLPNAIGLGSGSGRRRGSSARRSAASSSRRPGPVSRSPRTP